MKGRGRCGKKKSGSILPQTHFGKPRRIEVKRRKLYWPKGSENLRKGKVRAKVKKQSLRANGRTMALRMGGVAKRFRLAAQL